MNVKCKNTEAAKTAVMYIRELVISSRKYFSKWINQVVELKWL